VHCKKDNHLSRDCRFKDSSFHTLRKRTAETEGETAHGGKRRFEEKQTAESGPRAWVLKMAKDGQSCKKTDNKSDTEFYIDSGAFKTIINDPTALHNYRRIPNMTVECAGDQILYTEGTGDLKLEGNESGLSKIEGVTYIPGLTSNLLSVSSLAKNGLVTVFKDDFCGVYSADDVIIQGEPKLRAVENSGTYKINLKLKDGNMALKMAQDTEQTDNWHKRLGHLGGDGMRLLKNGWADGIDGKIEDNLHCETCIKSKHTRASFPGDGAKRATSLLEIVHSDVCEVTDGLTLEGHRYFVTFIDDKSRYTIVGLMKNKNEVLEKFKEYKTLVEKHTGCYVKTLRSDNGGEYVNEAFNKFCKQEGILRQFSIPYTPEQNGVAERANRTLLEKTRALLKESGLSPAYWGEALKTAAYLKNLCPTKAVDGMVPYEAWTGDRPNLKNLKIFGCCAYVHVPRNLSKKLADRSKICIFLGYDDEKKGFRLVDPERPKLIFVERNVIFVENKYPSREQKTENNTAKEIEMTNCPVITYHDQSKMETRGQTGETADRNGDRGTTETEDSSDQSSFWEEYTSTSISRLSHDNVSTSSGSTFVDVENSSTSSGLTSIHETGKRKRVPKQYTDFVVYTAKKLKNEPDTEIPIDHKSPTTFKEAMKSPEADFWLKAMEDELDSFEENKVWEMTSPPPDGKIVGNKWVYKRKTDNNGKVIYRARLVAKGFTQTAGVDYHEIYAPVVKRTVLRILFSTAVNFDLKIDHWDVKTAFLHGNLNETVYMAQPEGFGLAGD